MLGNFSQIKPALGRRPITPAPLAAKWLNIRVLASRNEGLFPLRGMQDAEMTPFCCPKDLANPRPECVIRF